MITGAYIPPSFSRVPKSRQIARRNACYIPRHKLEAVRAAPCRISGGHRATTMRTLRWFPWEIFMAVSVNYILHGCSAIGESLVWAVDIGFDIVRCVRQQFSSFASTVTLSLPNYEFVYDIFSVIFSRKLSVCRCARKIRTENSPYSTDLGSLIKPATII